MDLNYLTGMKLNRTRVEEEYADAKYNLGVMYQFGYSVDKDHFQQ